MYLAPIKKMKMKRYFKLLTIATAITLFTACKRDDDGLTPEPLRDYGEQYIADNEAIKEYLQTHYIVNVDDDMNISLAAIPNGGTQVSIWDQTDYPLQTKAVNSNNVDYTVYYIVLNEGGGESPTRADLIRAAYRGTLLDGTQFDYLPFPQSLSPLDEAIEGWQEIIPLFKTGTYIDIPDNPNPATFEDFGAGVMFLPSGLAYFNNSIGTTVPAYSPMIFKFKLYQLEYVDTDGDGILNKDETIPGVDIKYYDTDGDGIPNYLDTDDDGDGYPTRTEITDENGNIYPFEEIPTCSESSTVPKHLDPSCH